MSSAPVDLESQTPMMRQYLETKARVPDALLFFRLGDFYELFFDDAIEAARLLEITLTSRSKGDDRVPMCGVPFHAARGYVAKLVAAGRKVAICDQVEEPGGGREKLFRRELTRVVTPGMVLDDELLDPKESRWLAAAALQGGSAGVAFLDLSTGDLRAAELQAERLQDELWRHAPAEILAGAGIAPALLEPLGAPVQPAP